MPLRVTTSLPTSRDNRYAEARPWFGSSKLIAIFLVEGALGTMDEVPSLPFSGADEVIEQTALTFIDVARQVRHDQKADLIPAP